MISSLQCLHAEHYTSPLRGEDMRVRLCDCTGLDLLTGRVFVRRVRMCGRLAG